jgi:hypothetical protein
MPSPRRALLLVLLLSPFAARAQVDCGTWSLQAADDSVRVGGLQSAPAARPANVGDQETFYTHIPNGTERATLRHVGKHASFWVADSRANTPPAARIAALAVEFDNVIYPKVRAWFGSEWLPGVDGDSRVTFLMHDIEANGTAAGFGGYFSQVDEYPLERESNAREILYIDVFAIRDYEWFRLINLIAHEFTHLLNWHERGGSSDERWLEEGRAAYAEWTTYGNIHNGFVDTFLSSPARSLTSDNTFTTWYGASFLLLMYLHDHYGGRAFAEAYGRVPLRGAEAMDAALEQIGRGERVTDILPHWALANLLNNRGITPLGGYRSIPAVHRVPASQVTKRTSYPSVGAVLVREWGVAYTEFRRAPAGAVTFRTDGEGNAPYTAHVWRARTRDYLPLDHGENGAAWVRVDGAEPGETYTLILTSQAPQRVAYRVEQDGDAEVGEVAPPAPGAAPLVARLRVSALVPPRLTGTGAITPMGSLPTSANVRHIAVTDADVWAPAGWGVARFDRSDPATPQLAGILATQGEARDVATDGTTLYVAEDTAGVGIYDAETGAPLARANHGGAAAFVSAHGDHLFVLNARAGLRAYDVSDPADPLLAQSLFSGRGYSLRAIDDRLYVSDGGSGFRILAIDAMPAMPQEGLIEMLVFGAAPHAGTFWGGAGAELVGIEPVGANAIRVTTRHRTTGRPRDVVPRGSELLVAEGESGLRIVDVTGGPRTVSRVLTPGLAQAVATTGPWAYIADGIGGVTTVNIANTSAPSVVSHVDASGHAGKAVGAGGRIYLANGPGGLAVADRTGVLAHVRTRGDAQDVATRGDMAYVATTAGLEVVDLSDIATPVAAEPVAVPGTASGVALSDDGSTVYVAAGSVVVYGVAGLVAQRVRTVAISGSAIAVTAAGDMLAVAASESGFELHDISTPAAPQFRARVTDARNTRSIVRHADNLFVGAGDEIFVYDVANRRLPVEIARWDAQFDVRALATRDGRLFAGGETTVAGWDARNAVAPALLFRERSFRWVGGVALEGARLYVSDIDRLRVFRREDDGALHVTDPVTSGQPPIERGAEYVTGVGQSYPNPFNPEAWIPFGLAEMSRVEVWVYDVSGRLVRAIDAPVLDRGHYATRGRAIHWDGLDALGSRAPAGLYFYRFRATAVAGGASFESTGRMALAP